MGKPNINVGGAANGIQTYKTIVLKPNIPFAQQLGNEDTIYVIKWDYDLGGGEINVPANCVLKFDGGSLNNGSITLSNTYVEGIKGFGSNLLVTGTCINSTIDSEWFVFSDSDSVIQFKSIFAISKLSKKPVNISNGEYTIVNDGDIIEITQSTDFNDSVIHFNTNGYDNHYFKVSNSEKLNIPQEDWDGFKSVVNSRIKKNELTEKYKDSLIILNTDTVEFCRNHKGGIRFNQKEFFYIDIEGGIDISCFFNDKNKFDDITSAYYIPCNTFCKIENLIIDIIDTREEPQEVSTRKLGLYVENYCNVTLRNIQVMDHETDEVFYYVILSSANGYNLILENLYFPNSQYFTSGKKANYVITHNTAWDVYWNNVRLSNIYDSKYWGETGMNYVHNLVIDNSSLSRLDCHYRMNNLTVTNSEIGQYQFTLTGYGSVFVSNCRLHTYEWVWRSRQDFNQFFDGDVIIRDCTIVAHRNTLSLVTPIKTDWDYECVTSSRVNKCLGKNIIFDNITVDESIINLSYIYIYESDLGEIVNDSVTKQQFPKIYINNLTSSAQIRLETPMRYDDYFSNRRDVKIENCNLRTSSAVNGITYNRYDDEYLDAILYVNPDTGVNDKLGTDLVVKNCSGVTTPLYAPNSTYKIYDSIVVYMSLSNMSKNSETVQAMYDLFVYDSIFVPIRKDSPNFGLQNTSGTVLISNCIFSANDAMEDTDILAIYPYTNENGGYYFNKRAACVQGCHFSKRVATALGVTTRYSIITFTETTQKGYSYFNTDITPQRPVWRKNSTTFVDATGTEV